MGKELTEGLEVLEAKKPKAIPSQKQEKRGRMMEKEQIIKALGEEIKLADYVGNGVKTTLFKSTIALIKELTEENDKLRKAKVVYETVDYCADDLAKALEENERLKNICNSYALQYGTARDKEVFLRKEREDTVRKFADRLKKECLVDSGYEVLQIGTIDRIAKEILNKTEEEKK